jgi:hypothetical protein
MSSKTIDFIDAPISAGGPNVWAVNMAPEQLPLLASLNQLSGQMLRDVEGVTPLAAEVVERQVVTLSPAQALPCGLDTRRGMTFAPVVTSYGDVIPHLRSSTKVYTLDGLCTWVEDYNWLQLAGLDLLLPLEESRVEADIDSSWVELPWTEPGRVVSLQEKNELFLPGVDFVQQPGRLILLDSGVRLLGKQVVARSLVPKLDGRASVMGSASAVEEAGAVRRRNTLRHLRQFCAAACQLFVAPSTATVRSVATTPDGARVVTDSWEGFVSAESYPEVGSTVREGEQLGGTFIIHHGPGSWWKVESWDLGLPLDTLWPVKGISTDNGPVTLTRAGDKLLIAGLKGSTAALGRLTNWLDRTQSTHAGLAASLGLADGETMNMPALDLIFGHILGPRKVVVLRYNKRFERVAGFVRTHLPLNCLVFSYVLP